MSEYWEKTIQLYSGFIEYPQMVPKYLKRPPFKYIFSIFEETHKKTNFAEGLFEKEELDKEFYSSSEKRMNFLKKLFKFIYSVLNKSIPLKPQSIIKGIESDKVNIFLQDMYEVAVSGKKFNDQKETEQKPKLIEKEIVQVEAKENIDEEQDIKDKEQKKSQKKKKPSKNQKEEQIPSKKQEHGKVIEEVQKQAQKVDKVLKKEDNDQEIIQGIKMGNFKLSNQGSGNFESQAESQTQKSLVDIKKTIQQICQNTNPLGKLVEFIDDDLESMNQENNKWKKIYLESTSKLEQMESEQDEDLKSHYDKIQELKEQISEQINKVYVVKSKILKNNNKIDELLNNLI